MIGRTSLFTAVFLSVCCTAAFAQSESKVERPRASNANAAASAAVAADAPGVRLAALIRRDGTIIRNKNVSAVKRIDTGVYCITPKSGSGITPSKAIVTLTPEYYYSLYNEIKVQWASSGSGCSSSQIAVYTLADSNLNGTYTFSNGVGFSIVIP